MSVKPVRIETEVGPYRVVCTSGPGVVKMSTGSGETKREWEEPRFLAMIYEGHKLLGSAGNSTSLCIQGGSVNAQDATPAQIVAAIMGDEHVYDTEADGSTVKEMLEEFSDSKSADGVRRPGHDALWGHFGLSYASWLTLPRVLLHEMPDEWQGKMAELLDELDATFPAGLEFDIYVQGRKNNKFCAIPKYLNNYRYPDKEAIDKLRELR